ncbi:MAG: hypothetical protein AAB372_02965 [Patescibacteria group bacterium]
MKFNLPISMHFSLRRKSSAQKTNILVHGSLLWRLSLIVLGGLLVGVVAYDGYVFLFHTEAPLPSGTELSLDPGVKRLNRKLLDDVRAILANRAEVLAGSGADLPSRTPFE